MEKKQAIAIVGAILLFLGVFAPIFSVPLLGTINYFQNGKGDGVIVLVLAIVSVALALVKLYKGLLLTGGGTIAILVFTLFNFQSKMSDLRSSMEKELAGNPFAGFGQAALNSIQLQWGWAVLFVGACLVITAGLMRAELSSTVAEANGSQTGERKCPFCAEVIRAEATICRFCKSEVTPVQSSGSADSGENDPNRTSIIEDSTEPDGSVAVVPASVPVPTSIATVPAKTPNKVILLIVLAVVVVAATGVIYDRMSGVPSKVDVSVKPGAATAPEWRGSMSPSPPPYQPTATDARLLNLISEQLQRAPNLTTAKINVVAENGRVTLTGTVETSADRAEAAEIAAAVPGVSIIRNSLVAQVADTSPALREGTATVRSPGQPRSTSTTFTPTSNPKPNSTGSNTPPMSPELEQLKQQIDLLAPRAISVNTSLNRFRQSQAAQGWNLRGDIVASQQRMLTRLNEAKSALAKQDVNRTRECLIFAETEVENLERFLGR